MKKGIVASLTAIALATGFTTPSMAEPEVTWKARTWAGFGHYTETRKEADYNPLSVSARNSDGTTASEDSALAGGLDYRFEFQLESNVKYDNLTARVWMAERNVDQRDNFSKDIYEHTRGWVDYRAMEKLSVRMGAIEPPEMTPVTLTQGTKSYSLVYGNESTQGLASYVLQPGLALKYHLNPYFQAGISFFTVDPFFIRSINTGYFRAIAADVYANGIAPLIAQGKAAPTDSCGKQINQNGAADICDNAYSDGKGNGVTFGISGMVSRTLFLKAGYGIGNGDKGDGGPVDETNVLHVSAVYLINPEMRIMGNFIDRTTGILTGINPLAGTANAANMKNVDGIAAVQDIALQFQKTLGPGKVVVGYGQQTTELSAFGEKIKSASSVAVNNDLVYDMPVTADKKAGIQFIYMTRAVTPDAKNDALETVNTFIGAALYADF